MDTRYQYCFSDIFVKSLRNVGRNTTSWLYQTYWSIGVRWHKKRAAPGEAALKAVEYEPVHG